MAPRYSGRVASRPALRRAWHGSKEAVSRAARRASGRGGVNTHRFYSPLARSGSAAGLVDVSGNDRRAPPQRYSWVCPEAAAQYVAETRKRAHGEQTVAIPAELKDGQLLGRLGLVVPDEHEAADGVHVEGDELAADRHAGGSAQGVADLGQPVREPAPVEQVEQGGGVQSGASPAPPAGPVPAGNGLLDRRLAAPTPRPGGRLGGVGEYDIAPSGSDSSYGVPY